MPQIQINNNSSVQASKIVSLDSVQTSKAINHIAFIMDGNGRWASKQNKKRIDGHKAGADTMQKIVDVCFDKGIKHVTIYALSTENLKYRPKEEIDSLIDLVNSHLKNSSSYFKRLLKRDIKVEFFGDLSKFDDNILDTIKDVRSKTLHCTHGQFNIAINYGARDELAMAVNLCVDSNTKVDGDSLSKFLYTKNMPDPDIIVRTGGDVRLSNFMLYQAAYSELFFSKTLWPDFCERELDSIIEEFYTRKRNFGRV
ncbi:MAG: di-trans,poly-cis-decaprenylcistransferase [Clostridiales bacterium]|jgi:undecaprenyl diphosphate synthase|nr:di-trans,poly-cis-decaprenylcistransferase [Clostridiales bacterium]